LATLGRCPFLTIAKRRFATMRAFSNPRVLLLSLLGLALLPPAQAELRRETVAYRDGDQALEGYLVWDDVLRGKRPGVMVVHEWWGLNDYARRRADMLAKLGYVAFAADMYGPDKVTEHASQAQAWYKQITDNIAAWRGRAELGLEVLRNQKQVDPERVAAIGYCFGGATVVELAYAGADLAGVVSFHGSLPPASENARPKAKILAFHGYADSFVPPDRVAAFQAGLERLGADWELVSFGATRHAFTNPDAGSYGMANLVYNAEADRQSWQGMQAFFDRIFAAPGEAAPQP
jgi:dienelactone hydrolase